MENTSKECHTNRRLRVLMFPWLAHSHISTFIELSKRLSIYHNFHIYFCSTEINLTSIKKNIDLEVYFSVHLMELVQLDLPHFPELPPHYHTTKNVPPHLSQALHYAFKMGKANFQNILKSLKPDLLIYDIYQAWAAELASSIHIPSVLLLCFGAVSCSWLYHAFNKGFSGINETYAFQEINLTDLEIKKLGESPQESIVAQWFPKALEMSSDIVLVKSWRGIEGKYIDHVSSNCRKEVIAIGPLNELKQADDTSDSPLIKFLNGREESSVVYVSFGSETYLSKEEREEMAYGLELSNASFIWVVRFPVGHDIPLEEALPEGFRERMKERGSVVVDGWAPQAKILEHSSIGGFVSHCGWSSFIESIYYGVPLLALPMNYDQPYHARLGVAIGVGVEILRDDDGKISKEEVARVIKEVVVEKKDGGLLKERAKELSRKLREKGEEDLHEAAEKLRSLCSKSKTPQ